MLQDIIIVWFLTMGVFALTKEQMPFEFWQKIAYDKNLELRSILFEPLTECLCCMASFWTCVWFSKYHTDESFLGIIGFFFAFLILISSHAGRAIDTDALIKFFYFATVFAFAIFLPTHRIDFIICMVAVVGINYYLVRLIGSCRP